MKIYKHDLYPGVLLLIYPKWGKLIGVPYNYSSLSSKWERCGLGTALYYYSQEKLDTMECVGNTEEDWDWVIKNSIDDSYLIYKGTTMIDKLHCPFCGAELGKFSPSPKYLYCPNNNCEFWAETLTQKVWQALIDGKKAQEELDQKANGQDYKDV